MRDHGAVGVGWEGDIVAIDKSAIIGFLKELGYEADNSMDVYIEQWKSWYSGKVASFHNYKFWNGVSAIEETMSSLQLGKYVSEQWANLLFNEKCIIAIDDRTPAPEGNGDVVTTGVTGESQTAQFVRDVFDRNDLYVKINEFQEKKSAFGTVAYIPYHSDGRIVMSYALADQMIPLSWEYGYVKELCVYSRYVADGKEYIFVQLFVIDDSAGAYTIKNILLTEDEAARKDGRSKYEKVENLQAIKGFENVEPEVVGSETRPFVVDRLNIANNIDVDSPFGLSVFANAIDSMKMCDTIFESYVNEFILGRKRVMVSPEAIMTMDGKPVFNPKDKVFYQLPVGVKKNEKPFVQELDMSIRADEHQKSLQDALNTFSYQCGLGENFVRPTGHGITTATQVISENNAMFRTLKKHEVVLESVIVDLIRLIIEIGIRHKLAPGLNPDAKITVKFDDSVIEDKDQEIKRRMAQVAQGTLDPLKFNAWYYNVPEDEAEKLMPRMPAGNAEEGMQ